MWRSQTRCKGTCVACSFAFLLRGLLSEGSLNQPTATHVLLVEDDPDQQEIYAALPHYNGFRVTAAGTMTQAVAAMAAQKPDVILLDVMLPDVNGLDAVALMRDTRALKALPIVGMTGYDIPLDRALAAGCVELLRKPLNGLMLVRAVERAIAERKASAV